MKILTLIVAGALGHLPHALAGAAIEGSIDHHRLGKAGLDRHGRVGEDRGALTAAAGIIVMPAEACETQSTRHGHHRHGIIQAIREQPIDGISSGALVRAMRNAGIDANYAPSLEAGAQRVAESAAKGEAILTLGAGSISQAGPMILEALRK